MSERIVTADLLCGWPLPGLSGDSDKEARGRVLVVAGSGEMPGASVLTALGALRAGAGKLQVATEAAVCQSVAMALPEGRVVGLEGAMEMAERADATVVGPGMIDEDAARRLAGRLAEATAGALVLDAAALPDLGQGVDGLASARGRLVLTPHAGEMAGMLGESREAVEADPADFARRAAARLGAVVALKGQATFIASPDGMVWRHDDGAVGLATSGSGDVLAGVIGGLLARGASPAQATVWGVALHGAAGRVLSEKVGRLGFLAREILPEIPRVMADLSGD